MYEYLDKYCSDGFKADLDKDENVHRSLPFFAATVGLQLAVIVPLSDALPRFEISAFAIWMHLLVLAWAGCLVATGINVFLATALREFAMPPTESEVIEWAQRRRTLYLETGYPVAEVEAVVEDEMRRSVVHRLARARDMNRGHYQSRIRQRSRALNFTLAGLGVVLLMGASMFSHRILADMGQGEVKSDHERTDTRRSQGEAKGFCGPERKDQALAGKTPQRTDLQTAPGAGQQGEGEGREAEARPLPTTENGRDRGENPVHPCD